MQSFVLVILAATLMGLLFAAAVAVVLVAKGLKTTSDPLRSAAMYVKQYREDEELKTVQTEMFAYGKARFTPVASSLPTTPTLSPAQGLLKPEPSTVPNG